MLLTKIRNRFFSLLSLYTLVVLILVAVVFRIVGSVFANLRTQNVNIGVDADLFSWIAALALLFGWMLAATKIGSWKAAAITAVGGVTVVIVRVGQLGDELLTLIVGAISYVAILVARLITTIQNDQPFFLPDFTPIQIIWSQITTVIPILILRMLQWLTFLIMNRVTLDPVASALLWCGVGWFMAVWAAWHLRRHDAPLVALFPPLILMGTISYYFDANRNSTPLVISALLTLILLLLAFNSHEARERFWKRFNIDYFDEVWRDLAMYVIPLSIALVVFVNVMPNNIVNEIVDRFNKMIRYRVENTAPAAETGNGSGSGAGAGDAAAPPPPSLFEIMRSPGLPRSHLITARTEDLSKELVMIISTSDLQTSNANLPRYYWRNITYDIYTGHGWLSSITAEMDYEAGQPIENADLMRARRALRQDVQLAKGFKGLMLEAGTLITVDHNFRVAWREPGDFFGATVDAESYRAVSTISTATQDQLRGAGENYPPSILDRYLILPDDVPPRVYDLARDLTATSATPYDRARAIENYLRKFPYTLDLYAPPTNRDVVDYFLFDLQRGYCDYYATAMVVLTRAAGVPARLATGYAAGKYDAAQMHYVVTEAEAHSWVEVYFPNYGWVEFEPTGGRAPIDREAEAASPTTQSLAQLTAGFRIDPLAGWWRYPLAAAILILTFFALWLAADDLRLRRLAPAQAINQIYARARKEARRLKVALHEGDTPLEFKNKIRGLKINDLDVLIDEYARANYMPIEIGKRDRDRVIGIWNRLRWRLWRRTLEGRFAYFAQRF
ncbi:MAG: transglutaminase domain-containing protein [Chloroflexi bacterium]|nr:transglutaminase domain-containing protein [Chloroflexota bacterium]